MKERVIFLKISIHLPNVVWFSNYVSEMSIAVSGEEICGVGISRMGDLIDDSGSFFIEDQVSFHFCAIVRTLRKKKEFSF